MIERLRSPEQPIPQMHEPASPEDQKIAEESLKEFQADRAATEHVLKARPKDIYRDHADPKEKTLKTRHAGIVEKAKREIKKIPGRFNKPGVNLKIKNQWDNDEEKNN